ncbi:dsba-like thioredoxin domain containing protein [Grosmannia clavigera kw1407]|uniref:Dsba-like thioredoxin domain containing protein n=1 Tax=Grosmannia clavigera (strain kw1407 / UAMH 11150) TaxID=655863 RepID=F0XN81_GROCL|nr:dsba-like thioredoxin domain containing protein [Grosmannia clavigera kw1407]EFX00848.1 dsba-like thioredoxin domain containing protein [Grosmannia clavigera kw1407]
MVVINIKVISDAVCPFCYVGKKRLERAIDLYRRSVPGGADDRFNISWLPFYLDPGSSKVGIPSLERMAQKFGADRSRAIIAHIRGVGATEGIDFTYAGKAGNTRDAHRLVQLAKQKETDGSTDLENAVITHLFRSYFEDGGDITSHDDLVAAAELSGLDGPEVRAWLSSGKGGVEVDAKVDDAYARGVSGVPHFIINDNIEIGGAQDVQVFVEKLMKARREA